MVFSTEVRATELLLIGYFAYTSVLALVLPLDVPVRIQMLVGNLTIFAAFALLYWLQRPWPRLLVVRDWLPLALTLTAYRQMGWFAPQSHTYELERAWIVWDRVLLRDWGLRAAIESLGSLLPAVLEISYLLVYAIGAFGLAMLYVYGARDRADRFLFLAVLGLLLSYAQFPFWPSEPPRTVFPGEDFPTVVTVFRRFNGYILGGYGIHTSVFPSAHVSGAFAAAWSMMRVLPERPWVGRVLLVLAILIAVATVYGRYHYAVDALAGFGVSLLALGLVFLIGRGTGGSRGL
jgi:membrane-associated phospholipid phosphatase